MNEKEYQDRISSLEEALYQSFQATRWLMNGHRNSPNGGYLHGVTEKKLRKIDAEVAKKNPNIDIHPSQWYQSKGVVEMDGVPVSDEQMPTVAGVYTDSYGDPWLLDEKGEWSPPAGASLPASHYLPFTRLVTAAEVIDFIDKAPHGIEHGLSTARYKFGVR